MSTAALAVVTVGRLREAWPWLQGALEPGRARRPERRISEAAMGRLRRLGIAERADRVAILRAGAVPSGATAAPANISAIDARESIADHLDDLAWRLSSALRLTGHPAYRPGGVDKSVGRVTGALDYLGGALLLVEDENVVQDVYSRLVAADELARAVCGVGPDRRPLHAECPCCGRRSLESETGSPRFQEWSISCGRTECRCRGIECSCKIFRRTPGMRHVWLERHWDMLAALLDRTEAA